MARLYMWWNLRLFVVICNEPSDQTNTVQFFGESDNPLLYFPYSFAGWTAFASGVVTELVTVDASDGLQVS